MVRCIPTTASDFPVNARGSKDHCTHYVGHHCAGGFEHRCGNRTAYRHASGADDRSCTTPLGRLDTKMCTAALATPLTAAPTVSRTARTNRLAYRRAGRAAYRTADHTRTT